MKWLRNILFFATAGTLISCATTVAYDDMLNDWVGKDRQELLEQWGPPTRQDAFSTGDLAVEYLSKDGRHSPTRVTPVRDLTGYNVGCRTVFVINNSDVITGWRREGYNCRTR